MKLVILFLSFYLFLSPGMCQVAAVQVLVALLYCTVPCCTVLYCNLVFVLNFCMSVASVKVHAYSGPALPLLLSSECLRGVSVCKSVAS